MNKRMGTYSAAAAFVMVVFFGASMLFGAAALFWSYLTSIFIAWSFVVMMCAFMYYAEPEKKLAGICGAAFGIMYALCNSFVYMAQLTTVRTDALGAEAARMLDFGKYGLMFNYDMMGYCLMALATFFAGITIVKETKADRWLGALLKIHGIFAISCFTMPLLGLFSEDMAGGDMTGTLVLVFWCIYFAPLCALAYRHFKNK